MEYSYSIQPVKRTVIDIPATSRLLKDLRNKNGYSVKQLQESLGQWLLIVQKDIGFRVHGGAQAHQRSWQNTSRELGPEDSRTLNNTSNPTFQGATKFDTATQSNVNMTRKEFYDEKRDQGKNIGNTVALNMMTAAEKKEQAMKKDTSLGDKLTDGIRASE